MPRQGFKERRNYKYSKAGQCGRVEISPSKKHPGRKLSHSIHEGYDQRILGTEEAV